MQLFSKAFLDLNFGLALFVLVAHIREYRQFANGERFAASSKEAYDFIEHSTLSVWWVLGLVCLALTRLNSLFIAPWMLCGAAGCFLVERLIVTSGLGTFISAGENFVQQVAAARAAEMDLVNSFLDERPKYPPNPPGVTRLF